MLQFRYPTMRGKKKKVLPLIGMVLFVSLALEIPAVAQGSNIVSIPDNLRVAPGTSTSMSIVLENSTGIASVGIKLSYNATVVNVTGAIKGNFTSFFGFESTNAANGWITINTYISGQDLTGDLKVADVILEAVGTPGDSTPLNLEIISMADQYGTEVSGTTNNGSFTVTSLVFDTGIPANPYPSISGIHNGTITPNQTIIVHKLYTYPCPGTGGHAEYAKIWNSSWDGVEAAWDGYSGDWHNITFNETFVLYTDETYSYTIRTGSYPQIHLNRTLLTENGWINCTKFTDANGKTHYNWIPAIRLF